MGTRRLAAWFGLGVALWGAPLVVIGLFPSAASAMVMLAIVGAGNALIDVGGFTLIARIAPANVLARVFGVLESVAALARGPRGAPDTRRHGCPRPADRPGRARPAHPGAVALSWRRLRALDAVIVGRDDELALLRGVPLLDALPLPALETVARQLDHVVVPAGETVFRQGDPGDRFYVVVAGTAQVVGDGRAVASLGPGDSFGEIALLRRVPRTATVRRSTSCASSRSGVTASWP